VAAAQQTGGECADELEACIIGEGGTLDCGGIFNCINSCATVECAQECQGQAQDGAALSEFQAIASCIATECPDQSEACAGAALAPGGACAAEVEACFGGVDPTDGGDGTESMEGADGPSDGNDGSSIPSFALPMKTPAIPAADFKSRLPKMPRM